MSKGVLIASIVGTASIIGALIIYKSTTQAAAATTAAVAGTSNVNKLAGQASNLLEQLGVEP
jgi:hypothetical protein